MDGQRDPRLKLSLSGCNILFPNYVPLFLLIFFCSSWGSNSKPLCFSSRWKSSWRTWSTPNVVLAAGDLLWQILSRGRQVGNDQESTRRKKSSYLRSLPFHSFHWTLCLILELPHKKKESSIVDCVSTVLLFILFTFGFKIITTQLGQERQYEAGLV